MASTADAAMLVDEEDSKVKIYKDALYDACRASGTDQRLFSQQELLDLGAVPAKDLNMLKTVLQQLNDERLLISCQGPNGLAFKWREQSEAEKYKQCGDQEQAMVYSVIDDAGSDGIWSQTILRRLQMHENVFKAAMKHLIQKKLVSPFKSVEHPTKKMYIKASLRPSDKATGGPWFTDQNLDEAFIEALHAVIYDFIKGKSTYKRGSGVTPRQAPKKGVVKGSAPVTKKRTAEQISGEGGAAAAAGQDAASAKKDVLLPMPAGYLDYPTSSDIAKVLSKTNITKTVLSEEDVHKLISVLIADNLVEQVRMAGGRKGFRIVRPTKQSLQGWAVKQGTSALGGGAEDVEVGPDAYHNGYTDVPCGKCPVFDLCEPGGPVGPNNCEYFQTWLGK
ncbi:related to RPC34 - DNA-directed RNA polymerase III, 34 KD subunit [Cephalotrichum gorgonifer]|uniref:DNA-directed RNA polymerase III subunit RPC6 n=1 Tax=Cephalotrichum gorgonifer TaxID=2041049 RepID=A0AAE8N0E1_9PEZI|nr:related to RPC34 - DNA-directed RNA polymerase III, 34 KD subunit [Cephalotrichum gorgonifer]